MKPNQYLGSTDASALPRSCHTLSVVSLPVQRTGKERATHDQAEVTNIQLLLHRREHAGIQGFTKPHNVGPQEPIAAVLLTPAQTPQWDSVMLQRAKAVLILPGQVLPLLLHSPPCTLLYPVLDRRQLIPRYTCAGNPKPPLMPRCCICMCSSGTGMPVRNATDYREEKERATGCRKGRFPGPWQT
ncbi:hypothetical protein DV515_00005854 [Chloebia gouldiae]|uniref:Uncharacterized protein n=1 Tax=Chloebia gouldiae TaxID=44316 RepID=A0A3L8SNS4_CHLGU|nr:hypothetical protein DV515_00005854 [Chloebia gouldiae]